jgi:hypothetical protein
MGLIFALQVLVLICKQFVLKRRQLFLKFETLSITLSYELKNESYGNNKLI